MIELYGATLSLRSDALEAHFALSTRPEVAFHLAADKRKRTQRRLTERRLVRGLETERRFVLLLHQALSRS